MKKLFFLAAIASMGLMTACSDDATAVMETPGAEQFFDNGKGYLNLNVSLPTTKGTRANGDFQDGDAKEYNVEDILLVIFAGATTDENAATLVSAYNLSDQRDKFQTNPYVQITTSANIIAEIQSQGITAGSKLFAFIILNDHQFFEVEKEGNKLLDADGVSLLGKTFAQFRDITLNETGRNYSENSFFMSNVPVASINGGNSDPSSADITTLVPFDYDKIYNTRQEAIDKANGVSFVVNVERALAKVTVDWDLASGELVNDPAVTYDVLGWILDNTNKFTYCTRHMAAADLPMNSARYAAGDHYVAPGNTLYRMVDMNFITTGQYRTYWAHDMNYDVDVDPANAGNLDYPFVTRALELPIDLSDFRANKTTYYCTENTFDVERQTEKNTTRIVVAAQFNGGQDFWTLSQDGTVFYLDETVLGSVSPKSIQTYIYSAIANRNNMIAFMTNNAAVGKTVRDIFDVTLAVDAKNVGTVSISLKPYAAGNFNGKTESEIQTAWGDKNVEGTMAYRFDQYINNEFNYYLYTEGRAYYTALIKHFGDYETPWKREWLPAGFVNNDTEGVYENNNANNYLGRYGIVRNNWYDIKVNGIREIGSNTIPSLPDTPDDPVRNFLNIEINITPWAMRTQSVIL